ncbi:hypothetical protein [Allohahella sp. A8]|uniref:hypothetical protein n=1 Tax=Allohahella sp. A8 TaxID=3141461 RepID=UPI003A7F6978
MNSSELNNKFRLTLVLLTACIVVFVQYTWQGNKGFNLWDEGFLWYGIQRVLLGEVPIRDFMAYDPGRYYWSAALLRVAGENGIMSVRASVALFQALGLFTGLLLIAQSGKGGIKGNAYFWLLSAAILVAWMFPRHKLFDISLSILLIGALTYLVKRPVPRRYFITGICVGLVAVFGRNHGVYGAVASLGVIAWLNIKSRSEPGFLMRFACWAIGVTVGFLPVFFMAVLIPGFAIAFWDSIRFLFEQKATNLPLPVPWPWTINSSVASIGETSRGLLIGLFFVGILLFGLLSVIWVVYRKLKEKPVPPALVASAFLALPYAHFAFSRADVGHLAQGIFPLLVGLLVILSAAKAPIKWPVTIALCLASFWVMHVFHPGWQCRASQQCVTIEISGDDLQIGTGTANDVLLLRELAERFAPNGQSFIAAPFWPGAYALLERKSPMWESYALFPRSETFELKEIARISESSPSFAFILDLPLDGREELRFKNTHPLIHQHILNNFEPVPNPHNPAYQIYKARNAGQ